MILPPIWTFICCTLDLYKIDSIDAKLDSDFLINTLIYQ
ncbi:hypothetical protein BOSEA31B_20504 [Hyphomicrobiales bacterium]|nr:hypothetical protein BOSEA31B_20504 [Hyphomicrobiales bacterium]CAH1703003.1 hypothetical protein BOSEA1005_30875 [Hyphomicrobiales bacterium]CAI0346325.1 hypothetical protein BO1005MUT1_500002 [Hyphomicrobiales bacterium]